MKQVQVKDIGEKEEDLAKRAKVVLPSLTHLSVAPLPPGYSQFFSSGKGCYVFDVDGRKYIDYMASYGPILLGHQDERVDNAVVEQIKKGNCLEGPTENMVVLAELLTQCIPYAEWAYFAKNGSDATSISIRVARAYTGKKIILRAPSSYHGSVPLFKEGSDRRLLKEGVLGSERSHQLSFEFNNVESVIAAVKEAGDDFAGIICAAFKWDYGVEQELPTVEFLQCLRKICDENDAVLICDDVRSSMRLTLEGAWSFAGDHGIIPDLSCMCKGIANGYEISALIGNQRMRKAVERVNATGSFWCNAVPMVAAIQTITTLKNDPSIHDHMAKIGAKLRAGLYKHARACGFDDFKQTGPVQMPYFSFTSEANKPIDQRHLIRKFCSVCVDLGIWFHPYHTMFLTAAHTDEDIEETLRVASIAFQRVAELQQSETGSKL